MKNLRATITLGIALVTTAGGCNQAAPSMEVGGYPEGVRANFLKSCSADSPIGTCQCILEQLELTLPISDLLKLETSGNQAVLKDDRVIAAVVACIE